MAEQEASGRSDVTFKAGEKTYTLRPTLGAAKAVSRAYGGFIGAFGRVKAYDFEAAAFIVGAGIGKMEPEDTEAVEQITFDAGVRNLVEPLSSFIERLSNRGLPISATDKQKPDGKKNA